MSTSFYLLNDNLLQQLNPGFCFSLAQSLFWENLPKCSRCYLNFRCPFFLRHWQKWSMTSLFITPWTDSISRWKDEYLIGIVCRSHQEHLLQVANGIHHWEVAWVNKLITKRLHCCADNVTAIEIHQENSKDSLALQDSENAWFWQSFSRGVQLVVELKR